MLDDIKLGDCEIKSVSFDDSDVCVLLYDPNIDEERTIQFNDVSVLILETNHMQNVISSIQVYQKIGDINFQDKGIKARAVEMERLLPNKNKVLYAHIVPISGAECLISCGEIKY